MSNQSLAVAEDYSTYDPPLSHHNHTKSLTSTWDMSESVIVIDPPLSISPISAQLLHKALFISHAPLPLTQLFTWGQLELSRVSALSLKSSHPPTPDQPVNNTEGTQHNCSIFQPHIPKCEVIWDSLWLSECSQFVLRTFWNINARWSSPLSRWFFSTIVRKKQKLILVLMENEWIHCSN